MPSPADIYLFLLTLSLLLNFILIYCVLEQKEEIMYDDWKLASPPDSPCEDCTDEECCPYDHDPYECRADAADDAADRAYDFAKENF